MTLLKRITSSRWFPPTIILWICLLSFGLLIPWMGLYADDWPFVYIYDLQGFSGVVQFIAWVRPFAGPFFALITALTGHTFWISHLVVMLIHFGDALLLAALLRLMWPEAPKQALWAAIILAVFPAFKQQPLAIEYFPHFVLLGLLLLSFITMIRASRQAKWGWMHLLSYVLSLGMFPVEYFFGQELMRPVLLGVDRYRRGERGRQLAGRVFLGWLPYLGIMLAFLVWRVFIQKFVTYQPSLIGKIVSDPAAYLPGLLYTIGSDVWTVAAGTWIQALTNLPTGRLSLLAFGGAALAALGPVLWLLLSQRPIQQANSNTPPTFGWKTALAWCVLGLLSMLFAGWPFWITGLPVQLTFPWDRPTLAFIIGSALLTTGLAGLLETGIDCLFKDPKNLQVYRGKAGAVAISLLAAFSCGQHLINANSYREEWNMLHQFYWQLAWRSPALEPGTGLVLNDLPFAYHVDKFLTPLLNYTYAPDNRSADLPYSVLDYYKLKLKQPSNSGQSEPVDWTYGTLNYHSDSQHLLLAYYDPPACLRLLGPQDDHLFLATQEYNALLGYSNLSLSRASGGNPAVPPTFLGPEPAVGWCYYFEQADAARLDGDWDKVVSLGDQAFGNDLKPGHPSEYLIFIEGYARSGQWDEARRLARETLKDDFYRPALCRVWSRLSAEPALTTNANQAAAENGCAN